jgi:flavin reductase (DIM6/NTAB) family NADH-FMN oxidoreductase RutF
MLESAATGSKNMSDNRIEKIDFDTMDFDARYKILTGAVIPRPIALVSTINADKGINVAPFSSFMIASVEAGYLAFSVGPGEQPKTTLANIRRLRQFVINTVSEDIAEQVQRCGEQPPANIRKVDLAKFRLVPSESIAVPRIAEAKIHFECRLRRIIRFGDSHMVVGAILLMHAQSGLVAQGKIDPLRYAPLGRIAGRNYCRVRDIVSV